MKIFETSDVVFKDRKRERQARNVRHAAAVWCNKTAGFEVIHGLLDRAMQMLEVPKIASTDRKAPTGYYIKERSGQCSSFLRGHCGHNDCLRLTLLLLHTLRQTQPSSQAVLHPFTIVPLSKTPNSTTAEARWNISRTTSNPLCIPFITTTPQMSRLENWASCTLRYWRSSRSDTRALRSSSHWSRSRRRCRRCGRTMSS